MPLYKRKSFALVEKPEDLNPEELIFQIRLTKEIFRDYDEYLNRINLYRESAWTCKATGKGGLTYEEALVSEENASKRTQNIPIQCVDRILHDIQFSMLNLNDLVNSIAAKFQEPFSEGDELYGKKDGRLYLCKIIKIVEDAHETQYEIKWLRDNHKVTGTTLLNGDDLSAKNPPFSKRALKSFIRDSTHQNLPWVLHDTLAKKHGIPTLPLEELKSKYSSQNGSRKKSEDSKTEEASENDIKVYTRRRRLVFFPSSTANGVNDQDLFVKYPIDDMLVKPSKEDHFLSERPYPCRDFNVPMDCVGDLLMVWDFCASFGWLLNLSPFSLEDFENSFCYKDSTPLLIVESYSALLQLLIKDNGKFTTVVENKKRETKITLINWVDYLCDFIEMTNSAELVMHISTIEEGYYTLLELDVKLAIFRELVCQAMETDIVRERLDEFIEERQALSAARRDEALDEGKKRREEKERKKSESPGKEAKNELQAKSGRNRPNQSSETSEDEQDNSPKKNAKKQKFDRNISSDEINSPTKREIHKLMKKGVKELIWRKSAEERKEFLEREIEKRSIRTSPLGKDRDFCSYWFFQLEGRIFVENSESTEWGYYKTKKELDALIGSLNPKGVRERALKKQLEKLHNRICSGFERRSEEATQRMEMEEALVRRSTRVWASPGESTSVSFLKYVNKWKDIQYD